MLVALLFAACRVKSAAICWRAFSPSSSESSEISSSDSSSEFTDRPVSLRELLLLYWCLKLEGLITPSLSTSYYNMVILVSISSYRQLASLSSCLFFSRQCANISLATMIMKIQLASPTVEAKNIVARRTRCKNTAVIQLCKKMAVNSARARKQTITSPRWVQKALLFYVIDSSLTSWKTDQKRRRALAKKRIEMNRKPKRVYSTIKQMTALMSCQKYSMAPCFGVSENKSMIESAAPHPNVTRATRAIKLNLKHSKRF